MNLYAYKGSVKNYDTVVQRDWEGRTIAVSEKKARTNLAYQWKRQHGKTADYKVTLPGDITILERDI